MDSLRDMKNTTITQTLAFACCGISMMASDPTFSADNFNIEVSSNNNDIAIQANNASLKELLLELERRTGIPVKFVDDTDERVSLNVGLTSVENAIGKITPNHMIVHENINGKKVIKELIIIPDASGVSGDGGNSSFLPNGQPAPAIEATPQTEAMQPPQSPEPTSLQEQSPNSDPPANPE